MIQSFRNIKYFFSLNISDCEAFVVVLNYIFYYYFFFTDFTFFISSMFLRDVLF